MCDVLVVFGHGKGRNADAQSLCVSPDDTLRAELASFLIDYVFTDPEDEDAGTQMSLLSIAASACACATQCNILDVYYFSSYLTTHMKVKFLLLRLFSVLIRDALIPFISTCIWVIISIIADTEMTRY